MVSIVANDQQFLNLSNVNSLLDSSDQAILKRKINFDSYVERGVGLKSNVDHSSFSYYVRGPVTINGTEETHEEAIIDARYFNLDVEKSIPSFKPNITWLTSTKKEIIASDLRSEIKDLTGVSLLYTFPKDVYSSFITSYDFKVLEIPELQAALPLFNFNFKKEVIETKPKVFGESHTVIKMRSADSEEEDEEEEGDNSLQFVYLNIGDGLVSKIDILRDKVKDYGIIFYYNTLTQILYPTPLL